jgi:hypothetical protein
MRAFARLTPPHEDTLRVPIVDEVLERWETRCVDEWRAISRVERSFPIDGFARVARLTSTEMMWMMTMVVAVERVSVWAIE